MKNTEQRVDSEIIGTPELENINPEFALNSEKKGVAAIKEAERRMRLDEEIEKNLSAGLDRNKAFVKKYKIVGNKRVLVIEVIKNKIKDVVKNDPDHFVFDEAAMKAMKELEEELTDPFAKNIYDNLSEDNKKILLDHLVDNPVSPEKSEIIKVANGDDVINILSEAANNTASYSDNGYLVQLANRRDLKSDTKISDAACLYNLISPDGKALVQRIDYASAMILLEEQSENYQNKLKEDFDRDAESRKELTAEEIQEANSFEELKNVISHSTGIMGETEYFTPKELLDTIDNVEKFGFHFVYAVTSSGGLRDKVELLLSQSFEADDESTKELESQEDEKNESTAETENTVENNTNNLEYEPSPVFKKYILSKLEGYSKDELLGSLDNQEISRQEVSCWERKYITGIVSFSSVGYSTYLKNIDEVKTPDSIETKSEKAKYQLVSPDGIARYDNLGYEESQDLLWSESKAYLEKINQEFETNKTEIEKELSEAENDNESQFVIVENEEVNLEPEANFDNPFNEKVSKYADSIGIRPEELATNHEFLNLSPEQQQFALETLRRTSLAKAKVEAHQTFAEEKAGKKWWQVGFAMNQSFHKERHKIEAIKNIESRGLEGYGETELAWLVEVIKNGPEIKMNDEGEVIVNCLQDRGFSDEQKELIAKYNEEASYYIEDPKTKKTNNYDDTEYLNKIKQELLRSCTDEERGQLFYNLTEAEKYIQLLKFLSANEETEEIIEKMAGRSLTGFDKTKAMAGAQKDKAGYAVLGFALRTGSKFAFANGAYVASALSYSTAPIVAAMVGGLRGYNQGRKSLDENNELAQLGIEDKSDTAKSLNLAVGTKVSKKGNEITVGLKNKLDNLVDKLEKLRAESFDKEEIKKAEASLEARIYYTKGKMDKELISYGSLDDRGVNYLELTNSLVRANAAFYRYSDLITSYVDDFHSKDNEKLTRQTNLYKGLDLFNKIPDVSDPNYREWAQDKERFEALQELSIEQRLASFLDYKDDAQSRKELKFLLKKTVTGAVIGASFAAIGSFAAEHLGINNWLNNKANWLSDKFHSGKNLAEASVAAKVSAPSSSEINTETPVSEPVVTNHNVAEAPVKTSHHVAVKKLVENNEAADRNIDAPIIKKEMPTIQTNNSDQIQGPLSGGKPATVEVVSNKEVVAPIEKSPIINNNTSVVEQPVSEVVGGEKVASTVTNLINVNDNAAKLAHGIFSSNDAFKTPESFLKQISQINGDIKLSANEELEAKNILDAFSNNKDYSILRKRLLDFENHISSNRAADVSEISTNAPTNTVVEKTIEVPAKPPVSTQVETTSNINQAVPKTPVVEQVSVSKTLTETTQASSTNNVIENHGTSASPVEKIAVENTSIADKVSIAKELHVNQESLNQSGNDLIYKGEGKSNVVFDLKIGGIKEAADINGKKIPNEFIHELINGAKMNKFTRGGGLEKIFTAWSKLGTNDKLVYESLSWFNKGTMSSEDLLSQIKGLYQVKTENIYTDAINKKFISSNGKSFDMTLKGIKKLIAFLPRK